MTKRDLQKRDGPDFRHEAGLIARGIATVAGIDEAGRGPLAGPVVAAAVILNGSDNPPGLDDSKILTPARRDVLFDKIMASADVGVGIADRERIDRDNILQATLWAMAQATENLENHPDIALIDGNRAPELLCRTRTLVGGDGLSVSIAAASIIAKVTRDRIMVSLSTDFPRYGWDRNKGYGTAEHLAALKKYGPTPHHRRSFAPVRILLRPR